MIDQIQPLLSNHFNLTVEVPLKAIIRGYNFAVVPVTWTKWGAGMRSSSCTCGSRTI